MSWNPLDCRGASLPPNVLLAGKLLGLWLVVHRGPIWWPRVHVPFLRVFDGLGPATPWVEATMAGAFLLFCTTLFLNRIPRVSCLALGTLVLTGIAMSRGTFSNNTTFVGCVLVLLGLHDRTTGVTLLRAQIALVYFGAGINKLLDADWRTGHFVEFWSREILQLGWYAPTAALLPVGALSLALGWLAITTELGLAVGFAVRRFTPWAIGVGLAFHAGLLLFTGGRVSWLFLYVMAAAFLAVAPWPEERTTTEASPTPRRPRWTTRPATYLAVALLLLWQPLPSFVDRTLALLGLG